MIDIRVMGYDPIKLIKLTNFLHSILTDVINSHIKYSIALDNGYFVYSFGIRKVWVRIPTRPQITIVA